MGDEDFEDEDFDDEAEPMEDQPVEGFNENPQPMDLDGGDFNEPQEAVVAERTCACSGSGLGARKIRMEYRRTYLKLFSQAFKVFVSILGVTDSLTGSSFSLPDRSSLVRRTYVDVPVRHAPPSP